MERDKHVAIVTDSGTSMRFDSPEARELGVTVVPLEIKFFEHGEYVPYSDANIENDDFYMRMGSSKKLPQTSGNIPYPFLETYRKLKNKAESIISIHITSKHSGVCEAATTAKKYLQDEAGPKTDIEVVDTKLASLGTWFPVEIAANLSKKLATLAEIKTEVNEAIEKTQIYVTLQTFENLKKGGRGDEIIKAVVASVLSIYPILGFVDGKLKDLAKARTVQKARDQMIQMVGDAGKLVRLAVVHANAPVLAEKAKEALKKIYGGDIPVYEAGPVLAVHAGPGAVGIAFQKA
jgi:DegV family protein with EDD domain